MLLEGKVAIVSGVGPGMGRDIALAFANEGADVALAARTASKLDEVADEIRATGRRALCVPTDVTKASDCHALVDATVAAFGHLDVLVNNAGLGGYAPVVEMSDAQWHQVLDVTLTSTFRMTRAVLPHMLGRRRGAIINNASVLGWRAQEGQSHYAAAKAGVMAFTRCVAMEAAPSGVRVNAVAPSLAMHEFLSKVTPQGLLDELVKREAFGRAAEPAEIANVIVFLASDYASYLTGEVISVSSQHP